MINLREMRLRAPEGRIRTLLSIRFESLGKEESCKNNREPEGEVKASLALDADDSPPCLR